MSILISTRIGDPIVLEQFGEQTISSDSIQPYNTEWLGGDLYFEKFDNMKNVVERLFKIKEFHNGTDMFSVGICNLLDFDCSQKYEFPQIDMQVLNVSSLETIDVSNLKSIFVNEATHITVRNHDTGLSEQEMRSAVALADCVVMYADKKSTDNNTVEHLRLSDYFKTIPVHFVSNDFISKHSLNRKSEESYALCQDKDDEDLKLCHMTPDWLAFYTNSSKLSGNPHICISPERMDKVISALMQKCFNKGILTELDKGRRYLFVKQFMYAIVLIHEFAHARMNKLGKNNLPSDESYYLEEPLANAIVLNYTQVFNKAERCPDKCSLNAIAKLFIESQIYPYNVAPVLRDVDIEKWMGIK